MEYEWHHNSRNGQCDAFDCAYENGPIVASIKFNGTLYQLWSDEYEYECSFYSKNQFDARKVADVLLNKMYEYFDQLTEGE